MIAYETCPLCGGTGFAELEAVDVRQHPSHHAGLPDTITWCECPCGHVFTSGYWEPAELVAMPTLEHQRPGHEVEAKRLMWGRVVERITAHHPRLGRWLDVGFGDGSLVMTADEFGWTAIGIEVRHEPVQMLASIGYDVRRSTLGELRLSNQRFDVVSMFDVLEHTAYPDTVLDDAHALLRSDGLLAVSLPNMACAPWREADALGTNAYWAELEHHHNFTRESLYRLLGRCGFSPVSYSVSERWRFGMDVIARKAA